MTDEAAATALLALWNDVDPALDAAYNEWHANEHVPERLTVPGIVWAHRWGSGWGSGWPAGPATSQPDAMPRYLTLYGLRDATVVESAPYQRLLNEPTPASRAMRPALRNLSRWICRLDACSALEQARTLVVCTLEQMPPVTASLDGTRPFDLIAERLPQAPGLPWLEADQARSVNGHALVGRIDHHLRAAEPGFTRYDRLRVGPQN